jgi:HD-GYP domain-containing protein (c-di-GMP phosphodiesterase class II)
MTEVASGIDGYIPVSLATISKSDVAEFPLFIRDSADTPMRLFRGADDPVNADELQRLTDRGVRTLYVTLGDHEHYQQYLRKNFVTILNDERLPITRRFGCLNEVVRDVLSDAFTQRDLENVVQSAGQLAVPTVELICRADAMLPELLKVLHHDYHTFTHSANVAYFCVMLAKACGMGDRSDLERIATGALLHDIGKLEIPEQILKKRGGLDDDEWQVIKRHPTIGFQTLMHRRDLTFGQLMMVYQHHERLDGSGYPVGISQRRIHPWAQLCAIVDVYEALTSHRPYRPRLPKGYAIPILDLQAGPRLNQGMWQCWKTIIQNS